MKHTDPFTAAKLAARVAACHDEAMALWLAAEDDATAHELHAAVEALGRAARRARFVRDNAAEQHTTDLYRMES